MVMYSSPSPVPGNLINAQCAQCEVRNLAICKSLPDKELGVLGNIKHRRKFERGEPIWHDDTEVSQFKVIVSGAVKLAKILPDGRDQIVGLAFPSDFLGNIFVAQNDNFAEAVTNVELSCFRKSQFEQALREHPNLEHALLQKTLTDLHEARAWMVVLGRKDATEKVASFLLRVSKKLAASPAYCQQPTSNVPTFMLPLNRCEIAACLGLTIETVCRKLTWMRKRGVIEITSYQKIEVCDPDALKQLAGTPI